MRQLTVRGFDDELEAALRSLADREGLSLNQAALRLMARGAGLDRSDSPPRIGDALDEFIGTWSSEEADELDRAVQIFETIDEDLWA